MTFCIYACVVTFAKLYHITVDSTTIEKNLTSMPNKLDKMTNLDFMTVENTFLSFNNNLGTNYLGTMSPAKPNCFQQAYRCTNETDCDCTKICSSDKVEKHRVWDEDVVFFGDVKLPPGLYCVPRKETRCKKNVSALLYTNGFWKCHCLYPQFFSGKDCSDFVACKYIRSSNEMDGKEGNLDGIEGNLEGKEGKLWDELANREIEADDFHYRDLYETISQKPRYRCICNGTDANGNQLVFLPQLPLHCFVDYCKNNVRNSSVPGYDGLRNLCDCGDYAITRQKNSVPNDTTSPCTTCVPSAIDRHSFRFNLPCFNERSDLRDLVSRQYPCPTYTDPKVACNYGKIEVENANVFDTELTFTK